MAVHIFACLIMFSCHGRGREKSSKPAELQTTSLHAVQSEQRKVPLVDEAYAAYRVGGDVKAPIVISRPEPKIPTNAQCRGLVQFRSVIDEHGNVTRIEDLSTVRDGFSRAFEEALRQTKFRPGTLHGKPVPVEYIMSVNIRCQ